MDHFATTEGTAKYRQRFSHLPDSYFRSFQNLTVSSIGFGTYLGSPDNATDIQYREAIKLAISLGCNVLDSAINYRYQRSERAVGEGLKELFHNGYSREEILLCTKGGFLSFDESQEVHPRQWFKKEFVDKGIAKQEDLVSACHCIAPGYIRAELQQSLENLQVKGIDLYYIHNPEMQLEEIDRKEFSRRMKEAFAALEQAVASNQIQYYGTATWEGYRVAPEEHDFLRLTEMVKWAEEVGGKNHHFKAIQLPFSLSAPEALLNKNQQKEKNFYSVISLAKDLGLSVFGSSSLMQGQVIGTLSDSLKQKFPSQLQTDAQLALHFVRSTPGITSALVGMLHLEHVRENLATAQIPPLKEDAFKLIFT